MALLPLALRCDPLDVLAHLRSEPGALHLAVPDPVRPVVLLGCRPTAELRIDGDGRSGSERVDPLDAIGRFVAETTPATEAPFPLGGGVVALFAYELGHWTVRRAPFRRGSFPLAVLRRYDPLLVYDPLRRSYAILSADPSRARTPWLERLVRGPAQVVSPPAPSALAATLPRGAYLEKVRRIHAYLHAGDAYQVNLTQRFTAHATLPPVDIFTRLARRHPVPYSAYLDLGDAQVLANSPELFLRCRNRRIETHPIKGTRPRGATPAEDAALAAELAGDEKERAEHVMIVDLERNDLGRICTTGSVDVDPFMHVATHPTLHHLVSAVRGRLAPSVGVTDVLRATFPGGSITGAPKLRAMEIIHELEEEPRGAYTGAIGLVHPSGDLELGLAIRTAVVSRGAVDYHAGGGIVVDSDPERELDEAWLKTSALRLALDDAGPGATRCSSG